MLLYHFSDPDCERFCAADQRWDDETLKEIKEKYNIFFMSNGKDGATPLMLIPRPRTSPLIVVGWEDDGSIGFNKNEGGWEKCFDSYWIESFIADLQAAKEAIDSKKLNQDVDLSVEYYAD